MICLDAKPSQQLKKENPKKWNEQNQQALLKYLVEDSSEFNNSVYSKKEKFNKDFVAFLFWMDNLVTFDGVLPNNINELTWKGYPPTKELFKIK